MSEKTQIPIAAELFQWPSDKPHLIGSQCLSCENVTFPIQNSCPKCGGSSVKKTELSPTGTLWTWTSQNFRPKPPYWDDDTIETFEPFFLGYVELPGQVRVESRLLVADETQLRIGMNMELVIIPFRVDGEGRDVMTYAYKPAQTENKN